MVVVQVLMVLSTFQAAYPEEVVLLRGNHEDELLSESCMDSSPRF